MRLLSLVLTLTLLPAVLGPLPDVFGVQPKGGSVCYLKNRTCSHDEACPVDGPHHNGEDEEKHGGSHGEGLEMAMAQDDAPAHPHDEEGLASKGKKDVRSDTDHNRCDTGFRCGCRDHSDGDNAAHEGPFIPSKADFVAVVFRSSLDLMDKPSYRGPSVPAPAKPPSSPVILI